MSDSQTFIDPHRLGVGEPDETKVLLGNQTWGDAPTSGGITALTVTERAGSSTNVTTNNAASATATCNAGEISIGGGADHGLTVDFNISESKRSSTTGWTITMRNNTGVTRAFTPRVICLLIT